MITIEIHNEALRAANLATDEFFDTHGKDYMDACGFAWVTAFVKGNTKIGKSFKAVGFEKSYGGGFQLWNPARHNTQSITAKEVGCQAYVETVKKHLPDVKLYAQSRMD